MIREERREEGEKNQVRREREKSEKRVIPGPNSTDKGLPVLQTGSPTLSPA